MTITTHSVTLDGIEQRYHVAGNGPICVAHSGGPGISFNQGGEWSVSWTDWLKGSALH